MYGSAASALRRSMTLDAPPLPRPLAPVPLPRANTRTLGEEGVVPTRTLGEKGVVPTRILGEEGVGVVVGVEAVATGLGLAGVVVLLVAGIAGGGIVGGEGGGIAGGLGGGIAGGLGGRGAGVW